MWDMECGTWDVGHLHEQAWGCRHHKPGQKQELEACTEQSGLPLSISPLQPSTHFIVLQSVSSNGKTIAMRKAAHHGYGLEGQREMTFQGTSPLAG